MNKFANLNELYKYVDDHIFELEKRNDAVDLFIEFRAQSRDLVECQKSQWEVEALFFSILGSTVFAYSHSTGKNIGKVQTFPSMDDFQEAGFAYLISRAKEVRNPVLKGKYNHLLWKAPKRIKNKKYAEVAVSGYLESIYSYYSLFSEKPDEEYLLKITSLFENLISIASEIKCNYFLIEKVASFLLFSTKNLPFYTIISILDTMVCNPRVFKKISFENTLEIIDQYIQEDVENRYDSFLAQDYLLVAIKISQKLSLPVSKWYNEIGLSLMRLASKEHKPDRNWIKANYIYQAAQAFKQAGNEKKMNEALQINSDLKKSVVLNKVKFPFNEQEVEVLGLINQRSEEFALNLLKESPERIYSVLAFGEFFPKHNPGNNYKTFSNELSQFFTPVVFDRNKNINKITDYNNDESSIKSYIVSLNFPTDIMYYLFYHGVKSGKLTYRNLIKYLKKESIVGKPYTVISLGNETSEKNYLSLIAPSLIEFFLQMQALVNKKNFVPNFVLCIDSLALKIEGLLRNICQRTGITTSTVKSKGMQELLLDDLLNIEELKELYGEDDLLFLKTLFSPEGMNIRNNIAHSFYSDEDYQLGRMLLLIAALLRIGNLKFEK